MTDNEVDRIIAEYMGLDTSGEVSGDIIAVCRISDSEPNYIKAYTQSLDSLIPVLQKLVHEQVYLDSIEYLSLSIWDNSNSAWFGEAVAYDGDSSYFMSEDKLTIQQAAAHATAKAIQELTNDN